MKTTIISLGLLIAAGAAHAANPMWVRDARISPDGTRIVFSYKGDLYTVPAQGGDAVRVTTGPAYESAPVWSPDGRSIAYASDRNGGKDIFIIPAEGGAPRQLTFNSAAETPEAFSPDGSSVVFSAVIQDPAGSSAAPIRSQSELYSVPVSGGKVSQILAVPAVNVAMRLFPL